MEKVGTLLTKSMTILDATNENRFFEGYLTVEMKDKQGEITIVDELYKVLPLWMDRGAPITDTHSNRVVGKGINFMKTEFESEGVTYPAIKITGKIHKNYELDTDIWEKIKSGEYRGLSFGGATKADRTPKVMKDGDVAYALTDLEHYEVAVCKDPAVPLALITDHNPLAKAMVPSVPRGDGKEIIKCTNFGCYVEKGEDLSDKDVEWFKSQNQGEGVKYPNAKRSDNKKQIHHRVGGAKVEKGEDWSNADITPATATNTVSQSTQTAKPVKIDSKVGDTNELDGGMKVKPTPLEGGIQKESPATTGTKGAVRGLMNTSQQGSGETSLITTETEGVNNPLNSDKKVKKYSDEAVHKVAGAILAGAARLGAGIAEGVANEIDDTDDEIEKSAYQTEDGNNQLGGQAEPDEKLVSAMGAQNKQNTSKEVEN